jgi:hypothetical protein
MTTKSGVICEISFPFEFFGQIRLFFNRISTETNGKNRKNLSSQRQIAHYAFS